jgi:hypothetical protein
MGEPQMSEAINFAGGKYVFKRIFDNGKNGAGPET